MRITNNMINDNAALNINGNKISVDANNTRMTTQKKIDRPSEDPVIAIRSLRLQTSLSKINQYYEKNIPDAQSWMDVTETALLDIRDIMTDVRTLCVKGATDTLTESDRKTIYTQLKKLQEQLFSEGNADYAGRTVFTGFRTDRDLVFMNDDKYTSYDIEEPQEAVTMKKTRFYSNEVTIPTNPTDVNALTDASKKAQTMEETDFYKQRMAYNLKNTEDAYTSINFYDKVIVNGNDTLVHRTSIDLTDNKYQTKNTLSSGNSYITVDTSSMTDYTDTYSGSSQWRSSTDKAIEKVVIFENETDWLEWSSCRSCTKRCQILPVIQVQRVGMCLMGGITFWQPIPLLIPPRLISRMQQRSFRITTMIPPAPNSMRITVLQASLFPTGMS